MSSTIVIPPGENLIDEVIRHLVASGVDYSGNLVLFPGKRPAHFLRRAIALRAGRSFIPPQVHSMSGFVDSMYRDGLGNTAHELQAVDAVAMLYELYTSSSYRIAGESFDTLDAFFPLGLKLFAELEEALLGMFTEQAVHAAFQSVFVGNSVPLWMFYEQFYRQVRERRMTTRALKYVGVAAHLSPDHLRPYARIIAAGFFALTPAEVEIFRTLMKNDETVLLFQEGRGMREQLRKLFVTVAAHEAHRAQAVVSYYQTPDSHGQVYALTGKLQEQCDREGAVDERTVVVLPSPDALRPVVQQMIPVLPHEEYNISLGYPVTRTPVFGFLARLMQLVSSMHEGKFHAPDYINFVLHPYTKNIMLEGRPDVTRILFHTIEERLARRKAGTFFSLEELENDDRVFSEAARRMEGDFTGEQLQTHIRTIHRTLIAPLVEIQDVQDAARKCIGLLTYVDEQTTANRHPLFRPYVETILESLDALARSLLGSHRCADPRGYSALLQRCLGQEEVPFPGTPLHGLQILGFLETRNLQFDTVYVLDMNDDVIPGSTSRGMLIPRQVRESLGLSTVREADSIAAYYFDVLISSAKEVHLFFMENGKRGKSRFVEQLMWEQQQKTGDVERVKSVGYTVRLGNRKPAAIPKPPESIEYLQKLVYSATALDTYLRCPLKFYYSHVLNLEEQEDVAGEIERQDIGNLIHSVLRQFFQETVNRPLTARDLDTTRMEKYVEEQFDEMFGRHKLGARWLIRSQIQKQLSRMLTNYQLPLIQRQQVIILNLEHQIKGIRKGAYVFRGRLDRIERRGDSVAILDYKTGGNENSLKINFKKLDPSDRNTWAKAIGSLQLPLYVLLYSEHTGTPIHEISPSYLLLGRNSMSERAEMKLVEEPALRKDRYTLLEHIIFALLDEIVNPETPFLPTDDMEGNCPRCSFTHLCGTQWTKGRRGS